MAGKLAVLAVGLLLTGQTACSPTGEVVVSAAASLTEAMEELELAYESGSSQDIVLNLAGSQELAAQIVAGSPAAVFASADPVQMAVVTDEGLGRDAPVTFASNRLVIVVPAGNPEAVRTLSDLNRVITVIGAPEVPIGAYTAEALARAGVDLDPASLEVSTRAVIGRITSGDADAGIVYATDAAAIEGVDAIELPADLQPDIAYEVVVLDPDGAAFLDFLVSDRGAAILRRLGFAAP